MFYILCLDKHITACICHHSIIESTFVALQNSVLHLLIPPSPNSWKPTFHFLHNSDRLLWLSKAHLRLLDDFPGFLGSSAGKDSTCNAGDPGSIPGLGRSAGEGIGYPPQYSWASLVAQLSSHGFKVHLFSLRNLILFSACTTVLFFLNNLFFPPSF